MITYADEIILCIQDNKDFTKKLLETLTECLHSNLQKSITTICFMYTNNKQKDKDIYKTNTFNNIQNNKGPWIQQEMSKTYLRTKNYMTYERNTLGHQKI